RGDLASTKDCLSPIPLRDILQPNLLVKALIAAHTILNRFTNHGALRGLILQAFAHCQPTIHH
ncbi:MAG TPA: hypothetical protein VJQ25_12490, partial [Nitrospira sp.]|nr:hypothetical protein [Nitrospira sp.]